MSIGAHQVRELAAAWSREAYQAEQRGAGAAQRSAVEQRLAEMHARVLRACADDLRHLADGKVMPQRG